MTEEEEKRIDEILKELQDLWPRLTKREKVEHLPVLEEIARRMRALLPH